MSSLPPHIISFLHIISEEPARIRQLMLGYSYVGGSFLRGGQRPFPFPMLGLQGKDAEADPLYQG